MKTAMLGCAIFAFVLLFTYVSSAEVTIEELEAQLPTVSGEARAEVLNALSQAHRGTSPEKMVAYGEEALQVATTSNAPKQEAVALTNLGLASYDTREYEKAIEYLRQAVEKYTLFEDQEGVAGLCMQLGRVWQAMNDVGKAADYYLQALQVYETLGKQAEMINALNQIGQLYIHLAEYERAGFYLQRALDLDGIRGDPNALRSIYKSLMALYFAKGDPEKGSEYYDLSIAVYENMLHEESSQRIAALQAQYEAERQAQQAEILSQQKSISMLAARQQIMINASLIVGGILLALFVIVRYRWRRQNQKARAMIAEEKARAEQLLLNVLPIEVAHELEKLGSIEPRVFDHVTACFVDVVGFSELSISLEPKFLISELNTIFTAFDEIIEAHQCERIKTMGDAYLFVCGMPVENPKHAENIVRSAYEIVQYLTKRNQYAKTAWQIQVGVHTGKAVGGVVGVKKYAYDVFGETINMAAKIEHGAKSMQITISEMTYQLVEDIFPWVERESLDIKGRGKMKLYAMAELTPSTPEPAAKPAKEPKTKVAAKSVTKPTITPAKAPVKKPPDKPQTGKFTTKSPIPEPARKPAKESPRKISTEPETEPPKEPTLEAEKGPTVKLIEDETGKTRLEIIRKE